MAERASKQHWRSLHESPFVVNRVSLCRLIAFVVLTASIGHPHFARAANGARWIELSANLGLKSWESAFEGEAWQVSGKAELAPANHELLVAEPGSGVIVSPAGNCPDLKTKQQFADATVHVEFKIAKGSNSGVKLMGLYEIQIHDSKDVSAPTASDCGGIYPRAETEPKYHVIDKGTPPRKNVAGAAGEWQKLDIEFLAPRFASDGQKTANAKFVNVRLNDQLIHENVEVTCPTGKAWRLEREVARGPLLLQGDHGAVAFRNVRVRASESRIHESAENSSE